METYLTYSSAAADQGATLILWPESTFPGFYNENAPEAAEIRAFTKRRHVYVLMGSTLSSNGIYTNSAVLVEPGGDTLTYAKRHLVPFGEYVPFRSWVPLLDRALDQFGMADFASGTQGMAFPVQGAAVAPLICYESVFPDLAAQGPAPDLLAILTDDTWYGVSSGPVWHASQAVLRAVENGCWVARAAATGISLIASPDGQIRLSAGLEEAGALVQVLGPARPTPWRAHGSWFLWVCGALLALGWIASVRSAKNV
jgi:apolipoprotein N-acyltransferase